ncbi:uncharacterized protein At5g39570-like [Hibiscus syriacus]|uniref:uncharacterized protein At5g39570-like n=1 Tax=Hibiscus syriacus TaxID=106335 RepID=UPI001924E127|nr:uncharacterized protein At5g39570-like [Hibiscus syriacus]
MPYYTAPDNDEPDEFNEYNPKPYKGGFDLFVTYGQPLEPCKATCYPRSTEGDFDYERPNFGSGSIPSAYGGGHGSGHGKKPGYDERPGRKSEYGEHGSEYGDSEGYKKSSHKKSSYRR